MKKKYLRFAVLLLAACLMPHGAILAQGREEMNAFEDGSVSQVEIGKFSLMVPDYMELMENDENALVYSPNGALETIFLVQVSNFSILLGMMNEPDIDMEIVEKAFGEEFYSSIPSYFIGNLNAMGVQDPVLVYFYNDIPEEEYLGGTYAFLINIGGSNFDTFAIFNIVMDPDTLDYITCALYQPFTSSESCSSDFRRIADTVRVVE